MSVKEKAVFNILYLNAEGNEIGAETPITSVESVQVTINVKSLVPNQLGTALLSGFMDERKAEFCSLVRMIQRKEAESKNKILTPGNIPPGLLKVH